MERVRDILFALLRTELMNQKLNISVEEALTEDEICDFMHLAFSHSIAPVVADALNKNDILKGYVWETEFSKAQLNAFFAHQKRLFELARISKLFEDEKIKFMPLKGSVISNLYPEPWLRTSCDIDILINEEDTDRATELLIEKFDYKQAINSGHDVSFFSTNDIHIELHFKLVEEGNANEATKILSHIWDVAVQKENCECHCIMPDEYFYLYHIAHMAKHFKNGGCGIRPFIDLWILNNKMPHNREKREILLKKAELLKFENVVNKAINVWLAGEKIDTLSEEIFRFIVLGGAYGAMENRVAINLTKKDNKAEEIKKRIFLPYETIKFHYPKMAEHKWTLPLMQIRRWCKLIFCGGAKRSFNEIKTSALMSDGKKHKTQEFLNKIGL